MRQDLTDGSGCWFETTLARRFDGKSDGVTVVEFFETRRGNFVRHETDVRGGEERWFKASEADAEGHLRTVASLDYITRSWTPDADLEV
jgi:hypothetical protein